MPISSAFRVFKFAAVGLLAAATLWAQLERGNSWLRGEIASDDPSLSRSDLTVELIDAERRVVDRVPAGYTGDFEFGNVAPGDYELQIVDRLGNVICEKSVQLAANSNFVTVRLPQRRQADQPISGQISVGLLGHKVPKKAQKEFDKACEASRKGKSEAAVAHLEKAIQIDPAFVQAYNNLGARYMYLNRFDKAREQFQRAYELDHNLPQVASNLAIADLNLDRYAEAETAARQALKLDATSNKARFLLGVALKFQQRNLDEAVEDLEAAGREIPKGYVAAAEVLARHGDPLRAAADLKKYLASGHVDHEQQIKAWLAELEQAGRLASAAASK